MLDDMKWVAVLVFRLATLTALTPGLAQAQGSDTSGDASSDSRWHASAAGRAFIYGTMQSGARGRSQVGAVDEGRASVERSGRAIAVALNVAVNTDALTASARGYPQLIQSGEIYHQQGVPDRGHPEHAITELSVEIRYAFTRQSYIAASVGAVGEPVDGPIPASERASAAGFPFAPIGDHAENLPETAFGVATLTVHAPRASLSASIFNGHEPSDNYTSFQFRGRHWDSFAARAAVAVSADWQVGVSWADIANAEPVLIARVATGDRSTSGPRLISASPSEGADTRIISPSRHLIVVPGPGPLIIPSTSLHRVTAAAYGTVRRDSTRVWSSTFLFSEQRPVYQRQYRPAALAETNMDLTRTATLVLRGEYVRKNDADLGYTTALPAHSIYNALGAVPTIGNEYNVVAISA